MSVVIHHGNAVYFSFDFKSALYPFEGLKGAFNGIHGYIQFEAHRNAGGCVVDVVNSRQIQNDSAKLLTLPVNAEAAAAFFKYHISNLEIGLGAHAVGNITFFYFWN